MGPIDRREFLASVAASVTAGGLAVPDAAHHAQAAGASIVEPRSATVQTQAFTPLALGSVRPQGWLLRQLRIQADGLSGHLDEFWPDVGNSQWFGGTAEGWERAPYWLDGAIPLAWLLDDAALKGRISRHMDHIITRQRADGWYGPYPADAVAERYDMWAILLANKVMAQYHEASGEPRALDAVLKSLRALQAGLDVTPLYGWGRFRWYEGLVPVLYAYDRTKQPWLLDLGRKLRAQGVDFEELFNTPDVRVPTPRRGLWKWTKHVVNAAMATKASALSWRLDQRPEDRAFATRMVEILDESHGQVTGMFSGDECLAGRNPLQGSELCAVVEYMYSLEHLYSVFGDGRFADRLERLAYNALPATIAPNGWSHQYVQQVNQVQCTINPDHGWSTNGPESNLFGLEPNYGCCTSNMHQGWPKFAANLWMRTPDDGLAAVAWAPCHVATTVRGVSVALSVETEYPFRQDIRITVNPERPVRFPIVLRVPAWADGASSQVGPDPARRLTSGSEHRIDREWNKATTINLRLPMRPLVTVRYNEAVAVERGPLVYSLKLGEEWTRVNVDKPHRELPHGDFEVRPTTPWNYGLIVDRRQPAESFQFSERPLGEQPFSPDGAPVVATAHGRRIPNWKMESGWAGELSPVDAAWADPTRAVSAQPVEEITLVPYGCTNIRITEFPRLEA